MEEQTPAESKPQGLRITRTIRFAVRESWDVLGLLCAVSFTLFVALALPIFLGIISKPLGVAAACFTTAPLFAGACLVAHKVFERDEPMYLHLWQGFQTLYVRSVGIALVQSLAFGMLAANLAFYGGRRGFGFVAVSILLWYLAAFWAMNCIYHYPLLIASRERIIPRDQGESVRIRAVFRNGFLLAFSSPGYSFAIVALFLAVTVPLAISAVGMALIGAAFPAFLFTRATRDHLIRVGMIAPDPDPDEPVSDEVWRMRG